MPMKPQPQPPRRLRAAGLLPLALGVVACSVSPVPEPPDGSKPALVATVGASPRVCFSCEGTYYVLSGEPGAASDAELVWGVNLDGVEPPVTVPTNPDGSFELALRAAPGDQVRLQSRRGAFRSAPRDFFLTSSAPEMRIEARPKPPCSLAPLEVDFGSVPVGDSRSRAVRLQAA